MRWQVGVLAVLIALYALLANALGVPLFFILVQMGTCWITWLALRGNQWLCG